MSIESFIGHTTSEALLLTVLISLPSIIASLTVGLLVALFSATTQIQEQTLSFAPKMVFVYASLIFAGPWIGQVLFAFSTKCFEEFATFVQ